MRILFVCSKNSGKIAPFIQEQMDAVAKCGIDVGIFTVRGKGVRGYLKNTFLLDKRIKEFQPDLIHAHYGLSGLLANLQRKVPVITTYHGSDINDSKVFRFSKFAIRLSEWNIFVSEKNILKSGVKHKFSLIPCGVNLETFQPMAKETAREKFGFSMDEKLGLFAGRFDDRIKNSGLAIKAVRFLLEARLIKLKDY
jgi:glycosyltransferase involved in cell wall biosynthesis